MNIDEAIEYLLGGRVSCIDQPAIGIMLRGIVAERDALLEQIDDMRLNAIEANLIDVLPEDDELPTAAEVRGIMAIENDEE